MRNQLATSLLLMMCAIGVSACVDSDAPDEALTADTDNGVTRVNVPDELVLHPEGADAIAHSNCGHMLYCNQGGYARYCYYSQGSTGCTNQNIIDDSFSDCQYVCGHTACLYMTVRPC